jgi:hypothetical protein
MLEERAMLEDVDYRSRQGLAGIHICVMLVSPQPFTVTESIIKGRLCRVALAACRTDVFATRNHRILVLRLMQTSFCAAPEPRSAEFRERTMSCAQNAHIFTHDDPIGSEPLSPTGC